MIIRKLASKGRLIEASYDTEKQQALDKWAKKLRQIVGIEEPEAGNIIKMWRFVSGGAR
jgi:hypothetical protein